MNEPQKNIGLAQFSTLKVGGAAQWLVEAKSRGDLIEARQWALARKLPFRVLGNGSNTLIGDGVIRGLVVKNLSQTITVLPLAPEKPALNLRPRFQLLNPDPNLSALAYGEADFDPVGVRLDSGVYLPRAIFQLIGQGITGLEWFAGIPATVGGGTYINLHGADKYWSDYLAEAEIMTPAGEIKTVPLSYFQYDYDHSILNTSGDLVLTVTLRLRRGPTKKALAIAKYWQLKKSHQPQRSLGCIFQNLSEAEKKRQGLPTPSIGYLIDKKLKLKGTKIGQAWIPQKHAGFVENLGGASAADVQRLIELVEQQTMDKLGIELKREIVTWPN